MEFGKLHPAALDRVDFSLPPEPVGNAAVLAQGSGGAVQAYIGCARWGSKEWAGTYYPKGAKSQSYLGSYARLFNCVELNATYYGTPAAAQIANWKDLAGERDFLFCPKLPQVITHQNRLQHSQDLVDEFVYAMAGLGKHAGPVFLMPDPQIGRGEWPLIRQFMADFPEGVPLFLELRHPTFFTEGYDAEIRNWLVDAQRGTVITDTAGRRDCVHMHLTVPQVFIRFVGNALHPTDYARIDAWVARLKYWIERGLERFYFIVHQPEDLDAPVLIAYLIEQLNRHCGLALNAPQPITPPTLF